MASTGRILAAAQVCAAASLTWVRNQLPLQGELVLTDVHPIYIDSSDTIVAYASGEAGVLLKLDHSPPSTSLGVWSTSLDLSFPFYFYGVYSFDENTTMLTGFIDDSKGAYGIIQFTDDGGKTWSADNKTADGTWAGGPIEFAGQEGLMLSTSANNVWRTSSGGRTWADWVEVPAGDGQWHAGPYVWDGNGQAWVAGSALCSTPDFGSTWTCGAAVDVMDEGIACFNATFCLTGGGEISPAVAGWVHISTKGPTDTEFNTTRALQAAFPIRTVVAVQAMNAPRSTPVLIAAGGNFFSGVGGIYSSVDGGITWSLDIDLGQEVKACRALLLPKQGYTRVYCVSAGSTGGSIVSVDI